MGWIRRLRGSFRSQLQYDIDDELLFHLEARSDEYVRAGMTPAAARDAALGRFGNVAAIRTWTREVDTIRWLNLDPRSMAALVVIAGIGVNAAILPSLFAGSAPPERLPRTGIEAGTQALDAGRGVARTDSWRTPACRFALFAMQTWGDMPRTMNYEDLPGGCPVPPYTAVGNVANQIAW